MLQQPPGALSAPRGAAVLLMECPTHLAPGSGAGRGVLGTPQSHAFLPVRRSAGPHSTSPTGRPAACGGGGARSTWEESRHQPSATPLAWPAPDSLSRRCAASKALLAHTEAGSPYSRPKCHWPPPSMYHHGGQCWKEVTILPSQNWRINPGSTLCLGWPRLPEPQVGDRLVSPSPNSRVEVPTDSSSEHGCVWS